MSKKAKQDIDKTGDKPSTPTPKRKAKPKAERLGAAAVDKPPASSGKAPVENTPTPLNETPETKNMEVHHHPQLEHKHKPWKEYVLEGFMIFVAVMMGFIAENIREGIDNSEHAKQLTTQLVQDLKADTAQLNEIYRTESQIVENNDTLFTLLQQPLQNADTKRIQHFIANSHSMWPFHPSLGAMGAIKNELHLKQFSNSEIISYFSRYERHIELLHTVQDINLQYQRNYLDPFLTAHFIPANLDAAFMKSSVPNGQMRNLTQADIDQLAADVVLIRIVTREMVIDNVRLKKDATDMLKYVIKQFDLEPQ
jgi:hypothetical protein